MVWKRFHRYYSPLCVGGGVVGGKSLVKSLHKGPSNTDHWCFFVVILDKLLNELVADLGRHSVHVTSIWYVKNILHMIYCSLKSGSAWVNQASQVGLNNPINLCLSRCIKKPVSTQSCFWINERRNLYMFIRYKKRTRQKAEPRIKTRCVDFWPWKSYIHFLLTKLNS